jgi:hypothetical protein
MIVHMVLFNFTECSAEGIGAMFAQLASRQALFKFQDFQSGENNSPELLNQGFTHAFVMRFLNAADRDAYLVHPEHLRIVEEYVKPLLQGDSKRALVVDI